MQPTPTGQPRQEAHPTHEMVNSFRQGKLKGAVATAIADHLKTCEECRRAGEPGGQPPSDSLSNQALSTRLTVTPILQNAGEAEPETLDPAQSALPMIDSAPELPPELAQHSRFRIIRELGRGGMGAVYLAEHRLMERQVAVKVINKAHLGRPDALPRFLSEIKAAAQLNHENIVRAYDAEEVGEFHMLVMEFVEGMSLDRLVQRKGPLPVAHACHYIRQAALGLQYASEQGMTHRDIKPQNLMLTPQGRIKVLDFGLARIHSEGTSHTGLTQEGAFMGTPQYVAPEQATDARKADTRADIYSLGCTLYFLLTGKPPFQEDSIIKLVLAHLEQEPKPVHELRAEVPRELSAIIARALAKDPARRCQKPMELAQALMPFSKPGQKLAGPLPATPATAATPPSPASPPHTTRIPTETEKDRPEPKKDRPQRNPFAEIGQSVPKRLSARMKSGRESRGWEGRSRLIARKLLLIGMGVAGIILIGAILGGIFLTVQTQYGDVVIELSDPAANVVVKVDGNKIDLSGIDKPLSLKAGEHGLLVTGTDFEAVAESFIVKKGEKQVVKASLKPKQIVATKAEKAPAKDSSQPPDSPTNVKPPPANDDSTPQPGNLAGRQGPLREQLLREGGGTEESEAAVLHGLHWIVRQQRADGSWSFVGHDPDHGNASSTQAATGLALLPLLGAGYTHKGGIFTLPIEKGIAYLLQTQEKDGSFDRSAYQHGIPTIAICEAYGMTKDPKLQEPAQHALDFIVWAQHFGGGWRYAPGQEGDTSCTGWALQALKAGQLAGLTVPNDSFHRVTRFLDSMEYPDGSGYGYVDRNDRGGYATCAIGLLCRLQLGANPSDPRLLKGLETLTKNPPSTFKNTYYCYYATQVMRHVGGQPWRDWNSKMLSWLLPRHSPGPLDSTKTPQPRMGSGGSWSPVDDVWGKPGGRLMVTSLALLTLETYYRHVPFSFEIRVDKKESQPTHR